MSPRKVKFHELGEYIALNVLICLVVSLLLITRVKDEMLTAFLFLFFTLLAIIGITTAFGLSSVYRLLTSGEIAQGTITAVIRRARSSPSYEYVFEDKSGNTHTGTIPVKWVSSDAPFSPGDSVTVFYSNANPKVATVYPRKYFRIAGFESMKPTLQMK